MIQKREVFMQHSSATVHICTVTTSLPMCDVDVIEGRTSFGEFLPFDPRGARPNNVCVTCWTRLRSQAKKQATDRRRQRDGG